MPALRALPAVARIEPGPRVGPNGNGWHAALGDGNTMPLTAHYSADGRLLDVERGALVPGPALKRKIAQLFGFNQLRT
jgi:hypothetical protein